MPISIPKDHKNARKAEAAQAKLGALGVDPATIADIITKILGGTDMTLVIKAIIALATLLKKK